MNGKSNIEPVKKFCPPKSGEVINSGGCNYYLGQYIGKGYFGAVYECTDDWGNELVAKVILPQNRAYDIVREQWISELQNLANLRHPNVTHVYDAFEYRDTFYLIIERCSSTLNGLINMPNLKGDVWLPYVARDMLQAVNFMHNAGYVHKDIHPGNVFMLWIKDRMVLSKDPVLTFKVGDLGITRLESDINVFHTMLAQWMLPPEHLAPQEFGVIGKQVDIYHTGLVLLSLLLGYVPTFSKEDVIDGKPRQLAEKLPSPYGVVIAKALRRHVIDRTNNALDMWRDLQQVAFAQNSAITNSM